MPSTGARADRLPLEALDIRTLSPCERPNFVVWVHVAKRPETRERRLRESLRLLAARQRLGLK